MRPDAGRCTIAGVLFDLALEERVPTVPRKWHATQSSGVAVLGTGPA